MKKTRLKKSLSVMLCIVLIAAIALFTAACDGNMDTKTDTQSTDSVSSAASSALTTVLGDGKTRFDFNVVSADGKETKFEIHTDKVMLGDALKEHGLISGKDSQYGLMVDTVNGERADFDTDGKYWALYIDGEYAMSGADTTEITEGAEYTFKVEK